MVLSISVLFPDFGDRDLVIILTNKRGEKKIHNILVKEFRYRGFKICCQCTSPAASGVAIFDPDTKIKTSQQKIDSSRIKEERFYQVLHFKTTWKSDAAGLELQGQTTTFSSKIFNPTKEIAEDVEKHRKFEAGDRWAADDDEESTSGYGPRSIVSATTEYEKLGEASRSSSINMEKQMTCEEVVDEVLRVVALLLRTEELPRTKHNTIHAWLKSLKTEKTSTSKILTTEELDREFGNITEAEVGPEGKEISIRSYHILIPPNAVKTNTRFKFQVSFEFDPLQYPQHLIPISLPLYCNPGDIHFEEKITMRLATWLRKADNSQNPVPVLVYTKRQGHDWKCAQSTDLTSIGYAEFKCEHFCLHVAGIEKSVINRVQFALQHILYRDDHGAYTSCHFLESHALARSMLKRLEGNSKIIQPPTYTSLVRHGDEIRIALESEHRENYRFKSKDSCLLKINEEFYRNNGHESFSFLVTPKPSPDTEIEFSYVIGDKKFLKRDQLTDKSGDTGNVIVKGGVAHVTQKGVSVVVEKSENESLGGGPSAAKIPRRALGGEQDQPISGGTEESSRRVSPILQEEDQEISDHEEVESEEETTVKEVIGD